MTPLSLLLLGFAMSTDAFAAAIGKGAGLQRPRLRDALRTGAVFGGIEALTPVAGWLLGRLAADYVRTVDHWIAFFLLLSLGLHMIAGGLRGEPADTPPAASAHAGSFWMLALTGLATSIDAMAVGAGLALVDVNILAFALVTGLCTLAMATAGVMVGRLVGVMAGRRAEIAGGAVLILVGSVILWEHLHGAA